MAEETKEEKKEPTAPETTESKSEETPPEPTTATGEGSPKECKKKLALKLPSVSALRPAGGCRSVKEWFTCVCSIVCSLGDLVRIRKFARLL